ncbi:uncharacterized protein LOC122614915 isoform X2 [Drosophila teissieri]|uniref:uncharacterized protein LOC122614915 isoform X2 n=1 Tax=Drosophila teissieri TaxID=7243 RepID=UPI001CBA4E69|nr:uncharacterized protein LOC122614915 isoform X2 [Drosophila teissieri]
MSCLKSVLQLLQVLTTLSGCNIYKYVEGRRVFVVNRKIDFLVGAVHRFWLRPYLLMGLLMNLLFWLVQFREGLTDLTPGSEKPLQLIYTIGLTVAKYQNVLISTGIAYHYSTFGAHSQTELNRTDSRFELYCESKGWSNRPTGRPEQKPETTEKSGEKQRKTGSELPGGKWDGNLFLQCQVYQQRT